MNEDLKTLQVFADSLFSFSQQLRIKAQCMESLSASIYYRIKEAESGKESADRQYHVSSEDLFDVIKGHVEKWPR